MRTTRSGSGFSRPSRCIRSQGTTGSDLAAFFAKGWTPQSSSAEMLGFAFAYDEEGTLLSEAGTGGASS